MKVLLEDYLHTMELSMRVLTSYERVVLTKNRNLFTEIIEAVPNIKIYINSSAYVSKSKLLIKSNEYDITIEVILEVAKQENNSKTLSSVNRLLSAFRSNDMKSFEVQISSSFKQNNNLRPLVWNNLSSDIEPKLYLYKYLKYIYLLSTRGVFLTIPVGSVVYGSDLSQQNIKLPNMAERLQILFNIKEDCT